MSTSARPNRAEVELAPKGPRKPGPAQGWTECEVEVIAVDPMPGEADLLSGWRGRTMTALLPPGVSERLPDRGPWRVRARLVGPATLRIDDDENA